MVPARLCDAVRRSPGSGRVWSLPAGIRCRREAATGATPKAARGPEPPGPKCAALFTKRGGRSQHAGPLKAAWRVRANETKPQGQEREPRIARWKKRTARSGERGWLSLLRKRAARDTARGARLESEGERVGSAARGNVSRVAVDSSGCGPRLASPPRRARTPSRSGAGPASRSAAGPWATRSARRGLVDPAALAAGLGEDLVESVRYSVFRRDVT